MEKFNQGPEVLKKEGEMQGDPTHKLAEKQHDQPGAEGGHSINPITAEQKEEKKKGFFAKAYEAIGKKYKDAGETLTTISMDPKQRQSYENQKKFASQFNFSNEQARSFIVKQAQRLDRLQFDGNIKNLTQADVDRVTAEAMADKFKGQLSAKNNELIYVRHDDVNWEDTFAKKYNG